MAFFDEDISVDLVLSSVEKEVELLTSNNPPQYGPVDCVWCKGSGRDNLEACPACNGNGKVLAEEPVERCSFCNGTGVELDRITYRTPRCVECGGSGWEHSRQM
jgi:DnaJ-class molecular chaperone